MGAWVSDNYEQVTFSFQSGLWKVHSAIKRTTGENVSLWQMDEELLVRLAGSQSAADNYVKSCVSGLQIQRRLHHPHILRINDVGEGVRPLSFSSEPISCLLRVEDRYSKDESLYIAKQLADALYFLHDTAKIAHLCIQPSSVCLTDDFNAKLSNFTYACGIAEGPESILVPIGSHPQTLQVPLEYMSLEQYKKQQLKSSTDVFSFAALVTSLLLTRNLYDKPSPHTDSCVPRTFDDDTREALTACLVDDPDSRPSFGELRKCTGICVMTTQILNYIDQSFTKTAQDKFAFFKGLFKAISGLSTRILMKKMIPFMKEEIRNDIRFGPAIVPLIINIGERFDSNTFMEEIFPIIEPYLTLTNPQELSLSIFASMNLLVEKIPEERYFEILYPIFTSALATKIPRLCNEAIRKMPKMIELLPKSEVDISIIPRLTSMISDCDDQLLIAIIKCLEMCLMKVDQSKFVKQIMPAISSSFIKYPTNEAAIEVEKLLSKINIPSDEFMRYCVPVAAVVSSYDIVENSITGSLCKTIQTNMRQMCQERASYRNQNKIQPRIQPTNDDDEEYYYEEEEEEEKESVKVVKAPVHNPKVNKPDYNQQKKEERKETVTQQKVSAKAKKLDNAYPKIRERRPPANEKPTIKRRLIIRQNDEDGALNDILFSSDKKHQNKSALKTKY